jgi:hypothetical protein
MPEEYVKKLYALNGQLLSYQDKISAILAEQRVDDKDSDTFFTKVKPFADEVEVCLKTWKDYVTRWIREQKPKHVHPMNIQNIYDNLTHLSVEAFYKDRKTKRLVQMNQSLLFTLEEIENQCLQLMDR